jgi:hypothetical protein
VVSFYFCGIVLVLLSIVILFKTDRQQNEFGAKIVWGLLGANLCYLVCFITLSTMDSIQEGTLYNTLIGLQAATEMAGNLLFTTTAWYFAFRYYSCAQELQYVHDSQEVPTDIQAKHSKIFKVMLTVNVLMSVSFIAGHIINSMSQNTFTGYLVVVSQFFYDIILLVSFTFYTIGVVKISKFVKAASSSSKEALDL